MSGTFNKIERYMEIYPDSALWLLNQIPHPEKLRGKRRADYALLLTQARDKNYLDSLQSDSLITFAVDYYKDKSNNAKAGKSFFYYGKVAALQGNDTVAMQAYQNAHRRLERTGEYGMLGKVHNYIGILDDNWKMYDTALEDYQKAAIYFDKSADTLGVVHTYRNIAWVYEKRHESDSACKYVQKAFALLKGDTLTTVYPSLLQLLGEQEIVRGNYSQAITCFKKAIKYERNFQAAFHYYFSLGDVYLKTGELRQAEACFKEGLSSERPYTMAGAYHYLHLLEKRKGSYDKALFYKGKSDSLLNVARNATVHEELITLQKEHESMRLLLSNERLRIEKCHQVILGVFLFFVFFVFVVTGYFNVKKLYKRQYRKHYITFSKKHLEELKQVIERNKGTVKQYLNQIESLKQEKALSSKDTSMQIEALEQKISILQAENKKVKEEPCVNGLSVLISLREQQLIAANISMSEQKAFFEYVNSSFDNFLVRLSKEYKLSSKALLFVSLLKLGFSNEELAFIFDVEPSAIWKRKQRLRATFKLKGEENLELFLLCYPKNVH